MEKEKLVEAVELAAAVYRLTEKIPADEILKRKIREVSLGLLKDFIYHAQNDIMDKVRLLGTFFILGQKQNWLDGQDCRLIFEKYKAWAKTIGEAPQEKEITKVKAEKPAKTVAALATGEFNKRKIYFKQRHSAIIDVLEKNNSGIGFGELMKLLKSLSLEKISPRTVRNDLKWLIEQKVIKQNGWAKQSLYKLEK